MLVSAVIPTFNHAQYVVPAVESALNQTEVSMEVIVVNDGSTDDTLERLQQFGDRITVISQSNAGLCAARNAGILAARGEWVALLDSDDVWHPDKTRVQLQAGLRDRPRAAVIGSPNASELGPELDPNPATHAVDVRSILLRAPFGPSGVLVKRACFDEVGGFDTNLQPASDRDMWLRLAVKYDVVRVLSPCWWYREHGEQMSKSAEKMFVDYQKVLAKFFQQNPQQNRLRNLAYAYMDLDAALCYRDCGQTAKALMLATRSLWRYPGSLDRGVAFRLKFLARTLFPAARSPLSSAAAQAT